MMGAPQTAHSLMPVLRSRAISPRCSAFALLYARLLVAIFSASAGAAQARQYRCRLLLTTYGAPQRSHRSTLPSGRDAPPLALYLRVASRLAVFRQSGHRRARGPPGKTAPQSMQVRSRITVAARAFGEHSGQYSASVFSAANGLPHIRQIRVCISPPPAWHRGWRLRAPRR